MQLIRKGQLIITGARTLCLVVCAAFSSVLFNEMDYRSVLLMAVLMAAAASVVAQDPISEYYINLSY